jgi:Arc/MetJ family transcription regulator
MVLILMWRVAMRTTVTLNDDRVELAAHLTGTVERSALVRQGIEALIQQESARRLARLGGSDPAATGAPRHRATNDRSQQVQGMSPA